MYAGMPYVGECGEDKQMRGCQHLEAVSYISEKGRLQSIRF
jgi:hypothetical protein